VHALVGFDLRVNDAASDGTRIGTLSWCDATGNAGTTPLCFGTIKLAAESEALTEDGENPDLAISKAVPFAAVKSDQGNTPDTDPETQAQETAISDEKEVPDNPKKTPWTAIIGICLLVVAGGVGMFFCGKERKKKEDEEPSQNEEKKDEKNDETT
jgi:hypothetical protein